MRSVVVDLMPFSRQMFVTVVPYLRAMAPSVSPDLMRWYFMAAFSAASFLSCFSLAISSFEVLPGVRVDAEERFFQQEGLAAQQSVLEVDEPLGVERLPVIAGLEMQVRPRAAPRRAAQTDDLPGLDPLVGLDHALRKVPVVGFQPVVVADDDQVAVAALVIFRNTHAAAERGVDRVAHLERQVDALMLAPPALAVFAAAGAPNPGRGSGSS